MSEHNYDWSKFILKIDINASVADVYHAWTRASELEKWFLRKAITRQGKKDLPYDHHLDKDDTYEWYWHGHDDTVVEKGKVLLANGSNKLQFSFTGGALVTVDIGEVAGTTIVMLTEEKIPTNDLGKSKYHVGTISGWTFYLANLKSYLEGGIDLRNKNLALVNMVNS
jgi:uncharacterized protein YndB with AHSA1/START domain